MRAGDAFDEGTSGTIPDAGHLEAVVTMQDRPWPMAGRE